MLAKQLMHVLLIVGPPITACVVFGAVWMAFRIVGSYLVDQRQVRPSRISAAAYLTVACGLYVSCVLVARAGLHALPEAAAPNWLRSAWPLLVAAMFCSWYIAPSIETLRNPPESEWRPLWYRGPDRPEWMKRGTRAPAQRFTMSALVIWVTTFCVLLALGQMVTGRRRVAAQLAHARHQAAVRRIEALGGLIQQGGYVSLANTRVEDADLDVIAGFDQLTALNLGSTAVSDDGLRHLQALRVLQELTLSGANVNDRGLGRLGAIGSLRALHLRNTRVTGTGFAEFLPHQRSGLLVVDLSLCPISREGLRTLGRLPCRLLRIDGTTLSRENLTALEGLRVRTLEIADASGHHDVLQLLRVARPDIRIVSYDLPAHERRRAD